MEPIWAVALATLFSLALALFLHAGRLNSDPVQKQIATILVDWVMAGRTEEALHLMDAQLLRVFEYYGVSTRNHQSSRLAHALSFAKTFHRLTGNDYEAVRAHIRVWTTKDAIERLEAVARENHRVPIEISDERPYVFISYAKQDASMMHLVRLKLAQAGINSWSDQSLKVGENWQHQLEEKLGEAALVLVLWSANSLSSAPVRIEADFALKRDSLMQAKIDYASPPLTYRHLQYSDLTYWSGEDTPEWAALISALNTRLS